MPRRCDCVKQISRDAKTLMMVQFPQGSLKNKIRNHTRPSKGLEINSKQQMRIAPSSNLDRIHSLADLSQQASDFEYKPLSIAFFYFCEFTSFFLGRGGRILELENCEFTSFHFFIHLSLIFTINTDSTNY
jgi:hypothetical protein